MSTEIVVTPESIETSTEENKTSSGSRAEGQSSAFDSSANNESKASGRSEGRSETAAGESRGNAGGNTVRQREMTTTTLVRLMGLPTATEFSMLESKIDNLSSKVSTLVSKLERLSGQMPQLFHDFDRTNTQIADLREFVRKALASVVSHLDTNAQLDDVLARSTKSASAGGAAAEATPDSEKKKAKVLSSE